MIRPNFIAKGIPAKMVAAVCATALIAVPVGQVALQADASFAEAGQQVTEDVMPYALEAAMGIPGYDVAMMFLNGNDVPLDELKEIDLAALGSLYPKLATSIAERIAELEGSVDTGADAPDSAAGDAPDVSAGAEDVEDAAGDAASSDGQGTEVAGAGSAGVVGGAEGTGSAGAGPSADLVVGGDVAGSSSEAASVAPVVLPFSPGSAQDVDADKGYAAAPGDVVAPSAEDAYAPNEAYPEWSYEGDTTYITKHYTDDWGTERFIAVIGEQARQVSQERDLYASLMIAKAVLTSNSGLSAEYLATRDLFDLPSYDEGVAATQAAISVYQSQAPVHALAGITSSGAHVQSQITPEKAAQASAPLVDILMQGEEALEVSDGDLQSGQPESENAVASSLWVSSERFETDLDSLDDFGRRLRVLAQVPGSQIRQSQSEDWEEALAYLVQVQVVSADEAERMAKVIEEYDLTRFDEALDYELVQPILYTQVDPLTGEAVEVQLSLADLMAKVTEYLGVPYVWGGTTPDGFDCSGLVQYAYRHALGIDIPRTTYYQCTQGEDVDFANLHMGDLLFFEQDGVVGHVAMYLADGYYIEAPLPGATVKVTSLDESTPSFAKRLLSTTQV